MSSLLHPAPAGQRKPLPPVQPEASLLSLEADPDRRWAMEFAHHANAHRKGQTRARSAKRITIAAALVTLAWIRDHASQYNDGGAA